MLICNYELVIYVDHIVAGNTRLSTAAQAAPTQIKINTDYSFYCHRFLDVTGGSAWSLPECCRTASGRRIPALKDARIAEMYDRRITQ
jgi:hypothetical protein